MAVNNSQHMQTKTRYYIYEQGSNSEKYGPYLSETYAIRDAGREQAETGVRHEVKAIEVKIQE